MQWIESVGKGAAKCWCYETFSVSPWVICGMKKVVAWIFFKESRYLNETAREDTKLSNRTIQANFSLLLEMRRSDELIINCDWTVSEDDGGEIQIDLDCLCRLREYWSGWTLMMMTINSMHCRVYLETLKSRCVESCSKERCAKTFLTTKKFYFLWSSLL